MPQVGFEHTTPVFERAKTVHTLDRAATVIGTHKLTKDKSWRQNIARFTDHNLML
jgi:hypothetical protein